VPANVLKAMKIVFVEHMDDVLAAAFAEDDDQTGKEAEAVPAVDSLTSSPAAAYVN